MKSAHPSTVLHRCLPLLLFLAGSLLAQGMPKPPGSMAYQGYLVGLDGVPLGDAAPRAQDLVFRIYDAETGGNQLWAEQQTATFDKGYFGVQLGEGAAVAGFTNAAAGISAAFVGTTGNNRWVELTVKRLRPGGSDLTVAPRVRLLSSPYAYLAQAASRLVDANRNELLSVSSSNLVASAPLTAPVISVPTAVVGNITISNSLNILGSSGGSGGRLMRTPEGAMRIVAGRHRWTNSGVAYLQVEPSPGYSVTRTAVGEYKITFDTAFGTIPCIIATSTRPWNGVPAEAGTASPMVIQSADPTVARKEFTLRLQSFFYDRRTYYFLNSNLKYDFSYNPPRAYLLYLSHDGNNSTSLIPAYSPRPYVVESDFAFVATGN